MIMRALGCIQRGEKLTPQRCCMQVKLMRDDELICCRLSTAGLPWVFLLSHSVVGSIRYKGVCTICVRPSRRDYPLQVKSSIRLLRKCQRETDCVSLQENRLRNSLMTNSPKRTVTV